MAGVLNSPLPDYLCRSGARRYVSGHHDCVLWVCNWIKEQRGVDPAAPWRGSYTSEMAARRLVARAGGLEALVADGMARAGLVPTDDPLPGDVGLITLEGLGQMFAIRGRLGWLFLMPAGITSTAATFNRGWSV